MFLHFFLYEEKNSSTLYFYKRRRIPNDVSGTFPKKCKNMILNDGINVNKPSDVYFFILMCTDRK